MQYLNGKKVIANLSGFLRNGDVLVLSEDPSITIVANDLGEGGLFAEAIGSGFKINLNGFDSGSDIAAFVQGSLGPKNIVLYARASRFAEIGGASLYQVDCMISEV